MPKPICVISLPENIIEGNKTSWEVCRDMMDYFEKTKPDYHWFVIPDEKLHTLHFEVFYEKDFTEIQYNELKEMVMSKLTKQKTTA
jgi:hypothetical protein